MLMASHNMMYRNRYSEFYDSLDMVRLNSPYYSKEELTEILNTDTKPKFIDINIQVRLKDKKADHDFIRLLKLIGKHNVEWVGLSNVEGDMYYNYVRELLNNDKIKICAKIETQDGCNNIQEILDAYDGIMVDTEDLAFQIGWPKAIKEKNYIYYLCEQQNIPHFRLVGVIFELKT